MHNFDEEIRKISDLLDKYSYVAMVWFKFKLTNFKLKK